MGKQPDREQDSLELSATSNESLTLLLDELSALAAHHFASTTEAIEAILRSISQQIGSRSSLLTHITRDTGQSEVLAAFNAPNGCGIVAGSVLELPQTF